MSLVTTADLVRDARRDRRGIAAFNVITLEHAEGIATGAARAGRPAVLQISENAVRYHQGRLGPLAAAVRAVADEVPVPLSVHLDHVEDVELLRRAVDCGISSAMVDASRLPYEENVAATRAAAQWAHEHGVWLEAELGEIGGKDGAHAPGVRTDPQEALSFVDATGVDALAVAVGSSHAMVDRTAALDLDLVATLARVLPVPLVLHGSSGVPDDTLRAGVAAGLVKINIGTILNVAMTGAVRAVLAGSSSVDPRTYLGPGRDAIADETHRLLTALDGDAPAPEAGAGAPERP